MTEKLEDIGQFEAFSFKKKPLVKHLNSSNIHSVISDIIPHSSSRPISATNETSSQANHENEGYNDINYDEQIRAPRMSSITRGSFKDRNNANDESFVEQSLGREAEGLWNVKEDEVDEGVQDDSYIPANFDLSQPTRRFSTPFEVATDMPDNTILSYTNNNYIYERNRSTSSSNSNSNNTSNSNTNTNLKNLNLDMLLESPYEDLQQTSLVNALNNLSNNVTSLERNDNLKTNRIKHRTPISASHLSGVEGTDLQQVYRLKKPLCMPAVLRPQSLTPTSSSLSPSMPCSAETSPKKMNYSISIDCECTSSECESHQPADPTHKHWKPNSFTSHCMKCFEAFGIFFSPQRRRRHHCRFCGQIFCYECLWQKGSVDLEEDYKPSVSTNGSEVKHATVLDANARFVIPIYTNLKSNPKIRSPTDLFRNCKVCKDCGYNYQMLVTNVNSNLSSFLNENKIKNFNLPFIFIENPYVNNPSSSSTPHNIHQFSDSPQGTHKDGAKSSKVDANSMHPDILPNKISATSAIAAGITASSTNDTSINKAIIDGSLADTRRKSSVVSVPSDWTWSSF